MKKALFLFLTITSFSFSQNNEINLTNFSPPSAPAFVLMDISPSVIVTPQNLKVFSIQTLNAFAGNNNNGIPNNYAVEMVPYWQFTRENTDLLIYNNIIETTDANAGEEFKTVNGNTKRYKYNIFGDLWKKAALSFAYMDGTFEVFDAPRAYLSIGGRTTLIKVLSAKDKENFVKKYHEYEEIMIEAAKDFGDMTPLEIADAVRKIQDRRKKKFDEIKQALNPQPSFSVDIAVAYSHFLGDKDKDLNGTFGRFGAWLSTDLALNLDDKNKFAHFYLVLRYIRDGLNINSDDGTLFTTNAFDFGGKIELEFNKFSLAYEYISRSGDINTFRSLGSLRYEINDSFALTGGWGENFMSGDNTISLFGIQWGFDSDNKLKLPDGN